MVESSLPMLEQGKLVTLWRLEGELVASILWNQLACPTRRSKGG